jgi:hypothetical protein
VLDDTGTEETKVADAVDALIELYNDKDRTCYQLALLCIQITWLADPELYEEIYPQNLRNGYIGGPTAMEGLYLCQNSL